ncbi:hypothetical protein [Nonomuraea africana]|uniref:DNA-binding transcriptional MocR family regulator n=1 Tax=Nonomuraea africana TaxID=46171 RepID=A0ABR9KBN2_9ACTN|nr:hypothetical protein [Nonomuraea africana]MBE1559230.1 DNA-binding transcriptional MocR family regulator [Nonomuraea africana]
MRRLSTGGIIPSVRWSRRPIGDLPRARDTQHKCVILRLSFSSYRPDDITEGMRRLGKALAEATA